MELGAAAAVWLLCSIVAYLALSWVRGLWRLWRDWREAAAQRDLEAMRGKPRGLAVMLGDTSIPINPTRTVESIIASLNQEDGIDLSGPILGPRPAKHWSEYSAEDWPGLAAHADKVLPGHRCPATGCISRLSDDRAYCGAHTYLAKGRVTDCAATYPAYGGAIGNGCHETVEGNDWLCAKHRKRL